MNYENLLAQYRGIWNNRRLDTSQNAETTLIEAISRDLNDENAHPRARRSLLEKYLLATKRIVESDLSDESKIQLISLHTEMTDTIKNGGFNHGRTSL